MADVIRRLHLSDSAAPAKAWLFTTHFVVEQQTLPSSMTGIIFVSNAGCHPTQAAKQQSITEPSDYLGCKTIQSTESRLQI